MFETDSGTSITSGGFVGWNKLCAVPAVFAGHFSGIAGTAQSLFQPAVIKSSRLKSRIGSVVESKASE